LETDRSTVRYRSRRPDDGMLRCRLRELAAVRRRFGHRRLHILLDREGVRVNHKKLRRLYAAESAIGSAIPRKKLVSSLPIHVFLSPLTPLVRTGAHYSR
jgi:transposase InsO family protein